MIINLFSIFDPSLSMFSFSWVVCYFIFVIFPSIYWVGGHFSLSFLGLFYFRKNEVDYGLAKISKGVYKFILGVFVLILFYNFFAIFPHVFSITSHLLLTFPLAYRFWVGIIFFSFFKSLSDFLVHLIPVGTPLGLISFIVLVELLRNLIRPMALMFRLTANIMAGHLLIRLIGSFVLTFPFYFLFLGGLFQRLLVFMELGVSVIQAYVFSTLLLLYLSEGETSH